MNAIGYGKNEDIKNGTPPNIDILLVEQEVAASDEITALQMVVAADTKRTALLEEAKQERLSVVKQHIDAYADVNVQDTASSMTPLATAGGRCHWEVVEPDKSYDSSSKVAVGATSAISGKLALYAKSGKVAVGATSALSESSHFYATSGNE